MQTEGMDVLTLNKPNIILCMSDDQGWGDMAYYGHPVLKIPNFDAMAAEALRFDRFYAAAPVLFAHTRERHDRSAPKPLWMLHILTLHAR